MNIGSRLVDEYFAKTGAARSPPPTSALSPHSPAQGRCFDFREAADAVAKGGLRLFLGVGASTQNWAPDGLSCSLVLDENPLADFVELPEQYRRVCSSSTPLLLTGSLLQRAGLLQPALRLHPRRAGAGFLAGDVRVGA